MSELSKLNIHQRMLKATDEIERVVKGLNVEVGGGRTYKAVSEGDVLAAVKPVEIVNGIYSYPISRTITETAVLTNGTRNSQFMRVETIYRFVNIDNPNDYVEVTTYGDGLDSGDKAPGKAMTYADKYALLKAYKIETGDDPDKEASQEYKVESKKVAEKTVRKIEKTQKETIVAIYKDRLQELLDVKGLKSIDEMTFDQAEMVLKAVSERAKK